MIRPAASPIAALRALALLPLLLAAVAGRADEHPPGYIPSSPELGKAEGHCRPGETGPAVVVTAAGLKDRQGLIRAEVYPAVEGEFLADDNVLVMARKTFRRVESAIPASGPVQLCVRLPGPGTYALMLLHDRDGNRKFGLSSDGIGFPGNPRLGISKPKAAAASFTAGRGITDITIVLNYRRGLFSFGPLQP